MVLIVHNMVLLGRKVVVGFYVEPFTVPPKGKSRAQKSVCVCVRTVYRPDIHF